MKTLDGIQEGDRIKLVAELPNRGEYVFIGRASLRNGKWLITKTDSDWGSLGYFLGVYDWKSIEKI